MIAAGRCKLLSDLMDLQNLAYIADGWNPVEASNCGPPTVTPEGEKSAS